MQPNTMTQVKFTIESEIVALFKAKCASEGVSMASVIRQWMGGRRFNGTEKAKISTRPQRKKALAGCIGLLNEILEHEEAYRDVIPEQFTERHMILPDHRPG
jgi:hypothetical protein